MPLISHCTSISSELWRQGIVFQVVSVVGTFFSNSSNALSIWVIEILKEAPTSVNAFSGILVATPAFILKQSPSKSQHNFSHMSMPIYILLVGVYEKQTILGAKTEAQRCVYLAYEVNITNLPWWFDSTNTVKCYLRNDQC